VDIVLSGQVFEHVPFFWASLLEIARVMKPEAYFFLTVPSCGHLHSTYDCWRVYPYGLRAMAACSRLVLRRAFTDFPPPIRRGGSLGRCGARESALACRIWFPLRRTSAFSPRRNTPPGRARALRLVSRKRVCAASRSGRAACPSANRACPW